MYRAITFGFSVACIALAFVFMAAMVVNGNDPVAYLFAGGMVLSVAVAIRAADASERG